MPEWRVPLADVVISESEIAAIADVYRSGWLSMGPRVEEFEAAFAAFTGSRHAVAVTNATAGLHLACAAAGIGPGDEVIVPSMTFVATASAIVQAGGSPVFGDISNVLQPWLSATDVETRIGARTKAVIAVAYGGHPGEIVALRELADRHGLILLEDAAHAAGSRLRGRHLGTFGAAGVFSFFANKNLAIGEGGVLVTDDQQIADRARLLRSHGMTTMTWDRHRGHATGYDVLAAGFNYRIDEPRAALAAMRLAHLDVDNVRREEVDRRYREGLEGLEGVRVALPPPAAAAVLAHHLFTVALDPEVDRAAFRSQLGREGIQTSVHYPPIHLLSAYRSDTQLPHTQAYGARTVSLPIFAAMSDEQVDLVVDAVERAVGSALAKQSLGGGV